MAKRQLRSGAILRLGGRQGQPVTKQQQHKNMVILDNTIILILNIVLKIEANKYTIKDGRIKKNNNVKW